MNDIKQLDALFARIQKFSNQNMAAYSKIIAELLYSFFVRNFNERGRTGSGSGLFDGGSEHWADLKESTKKQYARNTKKHKPIAPLVATLQRRRHLRQSLKVTSNANIIFMRLGGDDAPYAAALHFGTKYMKARPILQLTPSDVNRLYEVLLKQFEKEFNAFSI